jgi:hypothetical protein
VYAVEASEMVEHAQRLISGNPSLGQRITVCFISVGFGYVSFQIPPFHSNETVPRSLLIRSSKAKLRMSNFQRKLIY